MSELEIAFIIFVAALAALVKAVTGTGYPMLLVPAIALFRDVADAVLLVALPNFWMNASLVWESRRSWSAASGDLRRFLLGSIVGGATGALLVPVLSDTLLRLTLVFVVCLFIVNRLRSPDWRIEPGTVHRWGTTAGGVSGVFQGAAGISGPLIVPWFLGQRLDRSIYLLSIGSAFALSGLSQILVFAAQRRFTFEALGLGALFVVLVVLLFPLGARLRNRLDVELFEKLVLLVLAVSAISLLVRTF